MAHVPRLRWTQLPPHLRSLIETGLGAPVIADHPQTGGYSPGVASRLDLADGRTVFAKAVSDAQNPQSPALYRREITAMRTLPPQAPAPRLVWDVDDGHWVVLVLEWIEGRHPYEPWTADDLGQVVTALDNLAVALTPSPVGVISAVEDLAPDYGCWTALASRPEGAAGLSPWARQHLGLLAELESGWAAVVRGDTLLHTDLRADNLLLTAHGTVLLDWAYTVQGAPWLDLALLLPSVAATTPGLDPHQVWEGSATTTGVPERDLLAVLAAQAGMLLTRSLEPAPPGIPGLREHQQAKGDATLEWLRTRLDGPPN